MRHPGRSRSALAGLASIGLLLSGCSGDEPPDEPRSESSADETPTGPTGSDAPKTPAADDLDVAVSEPREDSLYPDVGDPGVDSLHYALDLEWSPDTDTLDATETLTFRATETAEEFQLDFGEPLTVESLSVDGEDADYEHRGKDLVVQQPVEADERYELVIAYSGTPEPVAVPTERSDFSTTGWTITDDHETWTMQEPWGAYTWYAVNDHPSDKALYDFTLTVPSPWTGVANGELTAASEEDEKTTTVWHLAEPASSYLTTVAFGDFEMTESESESGVPVTLWTPRSDPALAAGPATAPAAIDYLEELLGPYPFDTFGIVVVDSESGMETQTMVTLGDTDYTTSAPVVVHELVHQWYGDQVSPNDWRDVWMNEGMAMYVQGMWEADQAGIPVDRVMDEWATFEDDERLNAGPPADYDPDKFGSGNIYYSPALMWHELRQRIGDELFFETMRAWPAANDNGNAGRDDYLPWLEKQTGEELSAFFDDWLLGQTTPPRD